MRTDLSNRPDRSDFVVTGNSCRKIASARKQVFPEVYGTRALGLWVEVGVAILLNGR